MKVMERMVSYINIEKMQSQHQRSKNNFSLESISKKLISIRTKFSGAFSLMINMKINSLEHQTTNRFVWGWVIQTNTTVRKLTDKTNLILYQTSSTAVKTITPKTSLISKLAVMSSSMMLKTSLAIRNNFCKTLWFQKNSRMKVNTCHLWS